MKKLNIIPKPIEKTDNTFAIVVIIALLLFCVSVIFISLYQTASIGNETKIIKIKYMNDHGIIDNCGHPIRFANDVYHEVPPINLSDTYEVTYRVSRTVDSNRLINYTLVEKEKYIENCSAT